MKRNRKFNRSRNSMPIEALIRSGLMESLMTVLMIRVMLADIAQNMVKTLQQVIGSQGMEDQPIDEDYANRFAAALYYVCLSIPFQVMQKELAGPINAAWNYMHDIPDKCSPAAVTALLMDGFKQISPTMATAVTEQIVINTGKLMLWAWMENGQPETQELFDFDRQFYFYELIKIEFAPDSDAIRREGYEHLMNMSADQRADYDPELFEVARKWAAEEGIDKAE